MKNGICKLRSLFSIALILAGSAAAMRAQSAMDGFDPNLNGNVSVAATQPDGKILIGGTFTAVAPNGGATVTRNRIARLNPDGTLDASFNPNANNTVKAMLVQADGKILIGGYFTTLAPNGGAAVTRNHIARLNPDGTLDTTFDPNINSSVFSIAFQGDGKILVGGLFTSVGGQARNYIARLDAATGAADSFNPNANAVVESIVVQADGKILAAGDFTSIGGQARNRIARLDPTAGSADSFNPNANNIIFTIAVQADGKILAGGAFNGANSIGGQARERIARLDPTTGAADSFNPTANENVDAIAVQADGKILAGGRFTTIGGQTRNRIARLNPATGAADSFDPSAVGTTIPAVFSIAAQPDGKVLIGGSFNNVAGQTRNYIARLQPDGTLDQTLNATISGSYLFASAVQPDGKILIGGQFNSIAGVARNNIARLNADGTLDMAFNPSANNIVYAIAVQPDGKILAGGWFTSIGGQTRNHIARLDPTTGAADSFGPNVNSVVNSIAVQADGKILVCGGFSNIGGQVRGYIARLDATTGAADSFDPNANNNVYNIAVQADGKILVGGFFTSVGGQTRFYIARLDSTTGLADSFNPSADNEVDSIAVQPDGKILMGGYFTGIGGQTRNHIARLDPITGLADSFNPNADYYVFALAVQADGKILVGGAFSNIGGQARSYIARLDATTGAADSFDPNVHGSPEPWVQTLAVQADGKILAGGGFTSIGGQPRNLFARLSNDTAALQNLGVAQAAVTWTRGGSSPQITRVTFESSTDNVNYTLLGDGMASGSNWTLSGLSLPTTQNIYIRARGFYRSGDINGSESIIESVRNAFIRMSIVPTAVVSRKSHGGTPRDINLPLTGAAGIECRNGGASNDYQVVFTFPSAVTFTNAAVTAGVGSVSSTVGSGTTTVTLNLTGVANAQRITVTLFGVNDGMSTGDVGVQMGMLIGDSNGNGTVNASDVSQTKGRIGQAVTSANFRSDVNANGSINASDASIVKSKTGSALPP